MMHIDNKFKSQRATKSHPIYLTFVLLITTCCLSGCNLTILDPQGPIAAAEKDILITSVWLMLIVIIPVIILTLVFAWHFRESNPKATYTPDWAHSTLLEIIWWSVPCIIIGILGTMTWKSSHQLDPYKPLAAKEKAITIQAIALEWKWLFIYPKQNIATINFIHLPVGVPVNFLITAEGPMNSFQIPQLAGQIYAMAGMQTQLNVIANKKGVYQGVSANFSGEGFSDMKFSVRASSLEEFENWIKTVKQSPGKLTMSEYEKIIQPSKNDGVKYFSSANMYLFPTVVMKSMMPVKKMACVAYLFER